MLARCADNALRVLIHLRIVVFLLRIFVLRFIEPATDRDRVQLVCADPAIQNFFLTDLRVEEPFPLLFHDRNWARVVLLTDHENRVIGFLFIDIDRALFLRLFSKRDRAVLILNRIVGADDLVAVGSEDLLQRGLIEGCSRLHKRIGSLFRTGEFLSLCLRWRRRRIRLRISCPSDGS